MFKKIAFYFSIVVFILLVLLGFGYLSQRNSKPLGEVNGVDAEPDYYNLGEVSLYGGVVTKEYAIANETDSKIKLRKIATSCMCTKAKLISSSSETKFFGMEHSGDKNALLNLVLNPGESARVVVEFDPGAHGPQGVGSFERIVWLTFSDPAGIKELKFDGVVIP